MHITGYINIKMKQFLFLPLVFFWCKKDGVGWAEWDFSSENSKILGFHSYSKRSQILISQNLAYNWTFLPHIVLPIR